jgi:hypothetical protein
MQFIPFIAIAIMVLVLLIIVSLWTSLEARKNRKIAEEFFEQQKQYQKYIESVVRYEGPESQKSKSETMSSRDHTRDEIPASMAGGTRKA